MELLLRRAALIADVLWFDEPTYSLGIRRLGVFIAQPGAGRLLLPL